MWDTYGEDSGCTGIMDNLNDPFSQGHYDCEVSVSKPKSIGFMDKIINWFKELF